MTETLVAQWRPRVRLYAQEGKLRASFVTSKTVGELTLPRGAQGPQGLAGLDSKVFKLVGQVANAAALPGGLGLADRGKTYAVMDVKKFGYWTGTAWNVGGSLAIQGPAGRAARLIRGNTTTLPSNASSIGVVMTPVDGGSQMDLAIPSGPKGPDGPAGPSGKMIGAADLNADLEDEGVLTNDGVGGWITTVPPASSETLTGTLITGSFSSGLNLLSRIAIPARDYPTRLMVFGMVKLIHSTTAYWWGSPDVYVKAVQVTNGVASTVGTGIWEYSSGVRAITIVPSTTDVDIDAGATGEIQIQLWLVTPIGKYVVPEMNVSVLRVPTT